MRTPIKSKPVEKQGRKVVGLKPKKGQDSQTIEKGKTGENRRRRAMDLKLKK
jgi:hypothetical protein